MSDDIEKICANCGHLQCGVWCLVWSQPTEYGNYCHNFEIREELLPTLEQVQEIYKNAAVEEPPTTAANPTQQEKESR